MKKVYFYSFLLWAVGTALGWFLNEGKASSSHANQTPPVVIHVSAQGYAPNNIVVQSSPTVIINFQTESQSLCLSQIKSSDLGIYTRNLVVGDNYITLKDPKPGVYHYSCGMDMASGTITIK